MRPRLVLGARPQHLHQYAQLTVVLQPVDTIVLQQIKLTGLAAMDNPGGVSLSASMSMAQ